MNSEIERIAVPLRVHLVNVERLQNAVEPLQRWPVVVDFGNRTLASSCNAFFQLSKLAGVNCIVRLFAKRKISTARSNVVV